MTDITATIQDGSTIRVLERTVGAVNRLRTLHDVDKTTFGWPTAPDAEEDPALVSIVDA